MKAPESTRFSPLLPFPIPNIRDACTYVTVPTMSVPKNLENLHACEVSLQYFVKVMQRVHSHYLMEDVDGDSVILLDGKRHERTGCPEECSTHGVWEEQYMHQKIGIIMNAMMSLTSATLLEYGKLQSNMAFILSIRSKPINDV